MIKRFHIGDVLSVTTGRLLSPRGMDGVYDILSYLTGQSLFTHQLPRAMRVCGPYLLARFPRLATVTFPAEVTDVAAWVEQMRAEQGEEFDVSPLPAGVYESRNPVGELVDMVGPKKVVVCSVPPPATDITPDPEAEPW